MRPCPPCFTKKGPHRLYCVTRSRVSEGWKVIKMKNNKNEKVTTKKQKNAKGKWSIKEIKRLYHETIKGKITVSVLALVIISLSLLGIISSILNNQSTNSTLKRNMNATAHVSAERVEWEITSYMNLVEDLGMTARLANDSATVEEKRLLLTRG